MSRSEPGGQVGRRGDSDDDVQAGHGEPFFVCAVIGAGPCGLSFVSRLIAASSGSSVDDKYADDEHARISHYLHGGSAKPSSNCLSSTALPANTVTVIDQLYGGPGAETRSKSGAGRDSDSQPGSSWVL